MKPVLVHYIDIGNLDNLDVPIYIEEISEACKYDNEYHTIFLPVRNQETKIECLNPIILDESEEKRKLINRLNGIRYRVNEINNKMPRISKNILLTERI